MNARWRRFEDGGHLKTAQRDDGEDGVDEVGGRCNARLFFDVMHWCKMIYVIIT